MMRCRRCGTLVGGCDHLDAGFADDGTEPTDQAWLAVLAVLVTLAFVALVVYLARLGA